MHNKLYIPWYIVCAFCELYIPWNICYSILADRGTAPDSYSARPLMNGGTACSADSPFPQSSTKSRVLQRGADSLKGARYSFMGGQYQSLHRRPFSSRQKILSVPHREMLRQSRPLTNQIQLTSADVFTCSTRYKVPVVRVLYVGFVC